MPVLLVAGAFVTLLGVVAMVVVARGTVRARRGLLAACLAVSLTGTAVVGAGVIDGLHSSSRCLHCYSGLPTR